jgi:hypothetical protein
LRERYRAASEKRRAVRPPQRWYGRLWSRWINRGRPPR